MPLRLLAVIEAYSITGPARNLLEFASAALQENVVTTIATFTRQAPENAFTIAVRERGIPLEMIRERYLFDPSALRGLRAIAERVRPHVIQTHAVKSHFLARFAGLPRIAPWIAFHHGYTWPTRKAQAYNQLDRWSLRSATKVLTVSQPFRDQLVAIGVNPARIEIVHNAIQPDWARSVVDPLQFRRERGISPDRKVMLSVGRLSREKDHLTLLDAVGELPPSLRPQVLIIGEGPERPRIEQKIAQLNLAEDVLLIGQQSSLQPWYAIADVAVLSSQSEGSPNALLEAMAAKVPVVATNVGGIPEIVAHEESALLVPPGDAAVLSAAIKRILTDPQLASLITTRARDLIEERHDPLVRMRKLVSIYRSLASQAP